MRIYETSSDQRVICTECRRWVHVEDGGVVAHSGRCSQRADKTFHQPTATPLAAARELTARETKRLAREGSLSVRGPDAVHDAYRRGLISSDDAMNQDF